VSEPFWIVAENLAPHQGLKSEPSSPLRVARPSTLSRHVMADVKDIYICICIYIYTIIVSNRHIYQNLKYVTKLAVCFPMKSFIFQASNVNLTNFKISSNTT
jgi:hypothetical protein